jgi:RNA polymerase sigma-70 factor (ECF subfamily)
MASHDSSDPRWRDDGALVHAVAAGDRDAVRAVVDARLHRVAGLARRMLGDAAEAEDVAQETFLRFWREARRWKEHAPIAPWLYRVAHNLCLDRLRRRRFDGGGLDESVPDPAPGPDGAMDRERLDRLVRAAIAGLPERQRTAISLVHDLDLDGGTAAAIMNVSVEALESLLARGRRTLRDRLGAHRLALLETLE